MPGGTGFACTWWEQAQADLRAAGVSRQAAAYEWACFQAQQAAEKAVKAFLFAHGRTALWSHSLRRLLGEAARLEPAFAAFDEAGRFLDQHYIPTRYPNGLDTELPPARYYRAEDADRCIEHARTILNAVRPFFES